MAFTLDLRDERGVVLERWSEQSFELAAAMPAYTAADYPYLRLVDPYGDTWFSRYQMEAVIPELERLARERPGEGVEKALEMASRCREMIGAYLLFIGD
jgi:hypothetical protein